MLFFYALQEMGPVLQDILRRLCVIWSVSGYYGRPEHMTSLLRRLSSGIIAGCSATISVAAILAGDVEQPRAALQQVHPLRGNSGYCGPWHCLT